jgi:exosortase/archaeosortase family protein
MIDDRVDGFVVLIGSRRYIVVDECAGMTYVTLAAFLGYCFGLLLYPRSFARVLAMASFGAVLGILSNLIRVNAIVLIDWMRGSQMDLTAHGSVQWAMLLATLGVLFFVLSRSKGEDAAAPPASDRSPAPVAFRRFAPVIAGACALSIVAGVAALQAREAPVPGVQAVALPRTLGSWTLAEPRAAWMVDPPGRIRWLRATYTREERDLDLVVVEALSADAKLPPSRFAPGERSVWREKLIGRDVGCAGSDCMGLVHVVWQRDHSEALRHAYFTYGVGPFVTDSRFAARALHGWHRLIGSNEHPTLTGFTSDAPLPADEIAAALRSLRSALQEGAALNVAGGHPD